MNALTLPAKNMRLHIAGTVLAMLVGLHKGIDDP